MDDDETRTGRRRELSTAIAARLKAARGGMTQKALGIASDIAPPTISRYENGRIMPSAAALHAIGDALGVDPAWLLTGQGEGPTDEAA